MPPVRHFLVPLLLLADAGRAGAEPSPDRAATAEAGTASRHQRSAAAAARLIADLGIPQPPLARPIEFAGFTVVSAEWLPGDGGAIRAFRFRGFEGDRLLEVDMSVDGTSSGYPTARVRRWRPSGGDRESPLRHSRALAPGEIEALASVLARRARSAGVRLDPSGLAAGIIQRWRESRAADH